MSALRVVILLAAVAGARPAHGYVRTTTDSGKPLFWPSPIVSYHVNTAAPDLASPTCAAGPSGDPALDAVRASFDAWQVSCSHLRLTFAGAVEETGTGMIGTEQNLVVFRQGFCSLHPEARFAPCFTDPNEDCGSIYNCFEDHGGRRTLALTSVLFRPSTGAIVDADIEVVAWDGQAASLQQDDTLRGWYFTCVDPAAAPSGECASYGQPDCYYADLQNTVTHEVGHFVGLRHVCDGGGEPELPACRAADLLLTMHPLASVGETGKRSLEADDVAGVCAAYPDGGDGGCGCGSAPGAVEVAALLALAALRLGRRRAR